MSGLLVVLSGPAGSGKTSLAERVLAADPGIVRAVTATTRSPRPGEVDGRDYFFLSPEAFRAGLAAGRFAEHAEFNGRFYGTPRDALEARLAEGRTVLLVIEVKGAAQIREAFPRAASVFVLPPSPAVLRARLEGRGTESREDIERRLAIAGAEVARAAEYDYLLVNGDLDCAAAELRELLRVLARHRVRGDETERWRAGGL